MVAAPVTFVVREHFVHHFTRHRFPRRAVAVLVADEQVRGVLLDLDGTGEIVGIVVGGVFLFATVAELTAVLAVFLGVGGVAGPEPVVQTPGSVEDGAGPEGNERRASSHVAIIQGDGRMVSPRGWRDALTRLR